MGLTIALLGAPRIEVDGEPLRVDTRKAVALLAYLAVTGRTQGRGRLAALLWPEYDDERSRAALRRTLSTLKSALGGSRLEIDRATVALAHGGDVEIDVARFRALAGVPPGDPGELAALQAAVALHRDELLAGFWLKDSVDFDDWQQGAAVELRRELAVVLDRLADVLAQAGREQEALQPARRRLELDPLDEPAQRRLIALLAATGNRAEALAQYRECVRVLDRELGVRPLPETSELYQAVNEGRIARRPTEAVRPTALPPRLLVGRATEWERLLAAYEACTRDGRLLAIEGEAGIGKTRLGDELAAHVRDAGGIAATVRSHPGEQALPYGLVADTLRSALAARGGTPLEDVDPRALAEAARLVPELAGDAPDERGAGPGARHRFYDGLARVIVAALAADGPPGLLVLDDLQWADGASLEVLGYLTRRLTGRPLLIVASWRSGEFPPSAAPPPWADAPRIRLHRLSASDVAQLAAAASDDPALAEQLYRESEGLPLFVVEYLAALSSASGGDGLPHGVREVLLSRVATVDEASAQLLAAAAVLGRSFDPDLLQETSGRSDDEVVSGLEELTARGLLLERADGYDFGHEKLREVVRERTSLARTRLLHRRAAEALASRRGDDPARVAQHLREAGRAADAAEAYRAAGDRARALYAYPEALEHYAAALALDHPDPAGLHESIGDVQTIRGEYRAALAEYETSAAIGPPERLPRLEHRLGRVHGRRGRWDLAERHFAAAVELGADDARIAADRSLAARHRGDAAAALALAERALALADAADDDEARAEAHNILGMLRDDRRHLEQSLALAERLADPSAAVAALNNLALACARAGDDELALELGGRALALCARQGDRHREAALHGNLADILHGAGRSEEAMEHLKRAAALFAEIGGDAGELQPEIWMLVDW